MKQKMLLAIESGPYLSYVFSNGRQPAQVFQLRKSDKLHGNWEVEANMRSTAAALQYVGMATLKAAKLTVDLLAHTGADDVING